MLQHAIFTVPNRSEGYTTDDNARALIFTVMLERMDKDQPEKDQPEKDERDKPDCPVPNFSARYLSFLEHALQSGEGQIQKLPWL